MGTGDLSKVAGGQAGLSGFRVWIEPAPGKVDVLRLGTKGMRLLRLEPGRVVGFVPLMLMAMILMAPSLEWSVDLFFPLIFIAMFFLVASSAQLFGAASWHALEHRSVHVLEEFFRGERFADVAAVEEALRRASSHHRRCGSILVAWLVFLVPLNSLVMPSPLAFAVSGLIAVYLYGRGFGVEEFGFPMQNLFLAEPKEEQLRLVAEQLYEYMQQL